MERNTQTEVRDLLPGDRFYKVSDKNKMVLQLVRHETKTTAMVRNDSQIYPTPLKSNTQAVFLRHADSGL